MRVCGMPRERSTSGSTRLEAQSRSYLRLCAQVESVNQQTQAAQKDRWRQVGGDHIRDSDGWSQTAIAACEVLNPSCQQHVQKRSTYLFAASGAGARHRCAKLRDLLTAMRTARQMREHRLPTEHARARGHRLILKCDGH